MFMSLLCSSRGPSMWEWLTNAVMHPGVPWDLAASRIVASAYEHTLLVQRRCRREDKQTIARIARCMRDVIVIAAISDAGGHRDQRNFKHALSEAFGRPLDNDLNAQMEHSYHQLTHGVPGAFVSGCKRGRLRRARVRQLADESSSEDEAEEHDNTREASSNRESAESAQYVGGAADAAQPSRDPPDSELFRTFQAEAGRMWRAVEREEAERRRLEAELRAVQRKLEQEQAE
ncbi:unnamed protein product, partial [Prorocentrum cordatum]